MTRVNWFLRRAAKPMRIRWEITYSKQYGRQKRPAYLWKVYCWGDITGGVAMTNAQAYDSIRRFIEAGG